MLLQALSLGVFRRCGGSRDRELNVRLVCSTSQDLRDVGDGNVFLPALYALIAASTIDLPRPDDGA
jgi:DNA-binding NtrC family response regulator